LFVEKSIPKMGKKIRLRIAKLIFHEYSQKMKIRIAVKSADSCILKVKKNSPEKREKKKAVKENIRVL